MDRGPRGLGTKKREYLALPVVAVANDYARSTLFERFQHGSGPLLPICVIQTS